MAASSRQPEGQGPLWAYDLLEPGTRRVQVRRFAATSPDDPGLVLWSDHGITLLAVAGLALGRKAPWARIPFRRPVDPPPDATGPADVALLGIPGEANRRPAVAADPGAHDRPGDIILVRPAACDGCGICVPQCPMACLSLDPEGGLVVDEEPCIECFACVEVCPRDAILPVAHQPSTVMCPDVKGPGGFLPGLQKNDSPSFPEMTAPAWQRTDRARGKGKSFYVLGLAMATMQENGAALLKDGVLVGCVEEERLSRIKHHGFRTPGREHRTICNDLSVPIEEAFAWRSVRHLLKEEGITLDDVDVFAVNGIPARFRRSYSLKDRDRPPVTLCSGRFVFVPHHLSHAASAFYPSGLDESLVFTVDGRGDRETAALFQASGGRIERIFDVLSLDDSSLGGVYETFSRILGFGSHGQGSTMALAAMGEPVFDMDGCLTVENHRRTDVHENGAMARYGHLSRGRFDPITDDHRNLAASVQKALEDCVITLIEEGQGPEKPRGLCLAGGVALNCQMNTRLRNHFGLENLFVQPAAHDAGTAIGAAYAGHYEVTGERPFEPMEHAYLGPEWDDGQVEAALDRFGLKGERVDDVASEAASRLAQGDVVAWFQGRLEAGPRALGARSLVADPSNPAVAARLNEAKGREDWRPFAPSILADHEEQWFNRASRNPFMLFVDSVRKERRDRVPAIVHADGTTRPQTVRVATAPRYHALISRFHEITGIPMVLNTSFNTADEPIVCSPADAVDSFLHLEADWLAMGHAPVSVSVPVGRPGPADRASDPVETRQYRRLLLRLGSRCNSRCAHCTLRDLEDGNDRDTESAMAALTTGRAQGCTEVVFMRGEPLIRPDIARLVRGAAAMGYGHLQVQTNGRMLAYPGLAAALLAKGVTFFEVSLYGDTSEVHDAIARSPGAFKQTVTGLRALVDAGAGFMVNVPVLSSNYFRLDGLVELLAALGARRVQFGLTRPVWLSGEGRFDVSPTVRLPKASPYLRQALRKARAAGLDATTESVVLCHLDPDLHSMAELPGDVDGQLVMELDQSESATGIRSQSRPVPPVCRSCRLEPLCPKPWAGATMLHGDAELIPFD